MSRTGWAAFAAMSVLWGGSYLLIEIAERGGLPAVWVAWLRICVGAIVLLALAARAGTLGSVRGHGRWLLAYAVSELAIPFPLIALGEVHVPSSVTAIIIAAVPLFGALLALRLDREERPTPVRAAGLALGFIGVVVLVGFDLTGSSRQLLGAGAILLAALGYALAPLVLKHGLATPDPRAIMGVCLAIAAVLIAPAAALDTPARFPDAGSVAAVLALGLVCTAAALVIFVVLIREAGPSRATVITYVNPVVALGLGVGLEGELARGGLEQAVGGLALVLAGSFLATTGSAPWPRRRRARPAGS
jgi:drug/metabolite transporter (DMT)-like permease